MWNSNEDEEENYIFDEQEVIENNDEVPEDNIQNGANIPADNVQNEHNIPVDAENSYCRWRIQFCEDAYRIVDFIWYLFQNSERSISDKMALRLVY